MANIIGSIDACDIVSQLCDNLPYLAHYGNCPIGWFSYMKNSGIRHYYVIINGGNELTNTMLLHTMSFHELCSFKQKHNVSGNSPEGPKDKVNEFYMDVFDFVMTRRENEPDRVLARLCDMIDYSYTEIAYDRIGSEYYLTIDGVAEDVFGVLCTNIDADDVTSQDGVHIGGTRLSPQGRMERLRPFYNFFERLVIEKRNLYGPL